MFNVNIVFASTANGNTHYYPPPTVAAIHSPHHQEVGNVLKPSDRSKQRLPSSNKQTRVPPGEAEMESLSLIPLTFLFLLLLLLASGDYSPESLSVLSRLQPPSNSSRSLCEVLIRPMGYPCIEHKVKTEDGYVLAIQHIPLGKGGLKEEPSPPVFLQHGLFMGGDAWFLNPVKESLGYILADHGFDVWVGNVRGTHWSYGHVSLSENQKAFWEWSWEDLAQYDLLSMINYVYSITNRKVFFVGHSQGTIMGLAAFTMPNAVEMIEAAALLCPISYLDHVSSRLILRAVSVHLDQILLALGIDELNFRSKLGIKVVDYLCDKGVDCTNLLSSITGENCCFDSSRIDYYLQYEPHPSSTKNLNHLFQMIRKGTFSKYDYGVLGNLIRYGSVKAPSFDLANIPESFPLWMAYGGNDALADATDIQRTIKELPSEPQLLYLDSYGHIDFLMSVNAKGDVYDEIIRFLQAQRQSISSI